MINIRDVVGHYDPRYPALDPTTPHYEFNSYLECCKSLGVTPSLQRFMRYQQYLKANGIK